MNFTVMHRGHGWSELVYMACVNTIKQVCTGLIATVKTPSYLYAESLRACEGNPPLKFLRTRLRETFGILPKPEDRGGAK